MCWWPIFVGGGVEGRKRRGLNSFKSEEGKEKDRGDGESFTLWVKGGASRKYRKGKRDHTPRGGKEKEEIEEPFLPFCRREKGEIVRCFSRMGGGKEAFTFNTNTMKRKGEGSLTFCILLLMLKKKKRRRRIIILHGRKRKGR